MAEIALKLDDLSRNEKKTLGMSIKTGLTGNVKFPAPDPTPAEIGTDVAGVETAETNVGTAEGHLAMEREALRVAVAKLDTTLTASAKNAIDTTTDEVDLRSANYPLKGARTPVGILDAPGNVHASDGDTNNSSDLQWDAQRRATGYVGEIAEAEAGPYRQVYIGTKSRCTVLDLDPTKLYFARICTQSTAGMGRWSPPVSFRAR
jgi:hypothetical protein